MLLPIKKHEPEESSGAPIRILRMSLLEEVNGVKVRRVYSLLPPHERNALLSNGHIACVPTLELIERWKIDEHVFEIAIPRAWVRATRAGDWCDRDPVPEEGATP